MKQRIIIRDAYVSVDEFEQAIVASNLVAVPYRDVERPSGIVSRAIAWRRPVIATNQGWLKWFVDRHGAGFLTESTNTVQFAQDLQAALTDSENFLFPDAAEDFRSFHTELSYIECWQRLAGLPRNSSEIST